MQSTDNREHIHLPSQRNELKCQVTYLKLAFSLAYLRGVRHFQESSYTQSRIKPKLTWDLWEKIAGRIRIFVRPQEEWPTPRILS